jgi:ParB-like nuclease domain
MKIAERLAPLIVPIASLREDPENVRIHPVRNMDAIKRSLGQFGQRKPIVVRDGVVIAGNGTLRAALELGATQIAAIGADDLTEAEAKAYGIMDNKSSDLGEWDFGMLGEAFRQLDVGLHEATGFADFERIDLLNADWSPPKDYIAEQGGAGDGHDVLRGLTAEQRVVIYAAIAAARTDNDQLTMAAALTSICQTYLDEHSS